MEVPVLMGHSDTDTDSKTQAGTKPMRADAVRNRARILEAAERVFALEGPEVPIDDVAREAGLGVGTIYRHFPTKEDLYEAVFISRVESFMLQAVALADADDPVTAFFEFLRNYIASTAMNKALHDSLVDAGIDMRATAASLKDALYDALAVLLKRAQAAGAVRDDIGIEDLKIAVSGVYLGIARGQADGATGERAIEILFDGLRSHAGR
jgi:AcrR family transcriptional regulator